MTPRPRRTSRTTRDPYEHAAALGLTVIHRPIRTSTGMWIPEEDLIVIRSGMRRVHDRSTLAHEIAHAVLGHQWSTPKHERQADTLAAQHLIEPERFWAAAEWCDSIEQVAVECDVSTKLARAFAVSADPTWTPSRPAA